MSPAVLLALLPLLAAEPAFPQVLDERLQIQLVADAPDVRTPTGIAVDERGRVLVIESHTHFPPPNYNGPKTDRILLLEDFDHATGKARKISTFFEGTTHTMNLAIYHDGSVYVATRMEVFRLRDTDDDGKADERTPICHLDTPGNYPHNGLSGLAFDFAGNVYFGFGENLGAEYKLIGSDGKELKGGGEGGNVYCCDSGGKNVRRVATGFWNPFGLGFDAFGRLFCVDNDPDSRPPCRLLHIVEGGDYGFRFRNGRKGVHPFTAWNGELPGTLPMVAGTGEAPCAVMAYESDNLPEEYRGDLLVTSWGDHRLERYKLRPRGASFGAEMTPVIRGGENFRPVGLALAPDGSLYMSDWVDKSYNLHGKGRVWRISAKRPNPSKRSPDHPPTAVLSTDLGPLSAMAALESADQFARHEAVRQLGDKLLAVDEMGLRSTANASVRLGVALAHRQRDDERSRRLIPALLIDEDPQVRLCGVLWIAESKLVEFRSHVEGALLLANPSKTWLQASLACINTLAGGTPDRESGSPGEEYLANALTLDTTPAAVRLLSLRSLPADHRVFSNERLTSLLVDPDRSIRLEAVRTLRQRPDTERWPQLREIANDQKAAAQLRCEAILGLSPGNQQDRKLLFALTKDKQPEVADEALRALRGFDLKPEEREQLTALAATLEGPRKELAERVLARNPPKNLPRHEDVAAWLKLAEGDGDPDAGERIYYHLRVGGCFRCHEFEGRGYTVGPDLSTISRSMTRERLVQSLVDPSREIAPQFTNWSILKTDGEVLTGIHVGDEVDGKMRFADQNGRAFHVHPDEIDQRRPSSQSIMPEGLVDNLTSQELRDLIAFLLRQESRQ